MMVGKDTRILKAGLTKLGYGFERVLLLSFCSSLFTAGNTLGQNIKLAINLAHPVCMQPALNRVRLWKLFLLKHLSMRKKIKRGPNGGFRKGAGRKKDKDPNIWFQFKMKKSKVMEIAGDKSLSVEEARDKVIKYLNTLIE
jgi:hypothetical protein